MPLDTDTDYVQGIQVESYQDRLMRIMRQIEQRQSERPRQLTGDHRDMEWGELDGSLD